LIPESWPTSQILVQLGKGTAGAARALVARKAMVLYLGLAGEEVPERNWTRDELEASHVIH
jgi:hypothetical protein